MRQALRWAWRMCVARPGVFALNLTLISLSVASLTTLLLLTTQLEQRFARDLRGVDLVLAARGSALQSILAGALHVDVPSGNIPLAEVQKATQHPLVASVTPVALGDSFQGFRIVGTDARFLAIYGLAQPGEPPHRAFDRPMRALLGAQAAQATGLQPGQRFAGTHGLQLGGEVHAKALYEVTEVLPACYCVLDRLILTAVSSVWWVHDKETALDEADEQALRQAMDEEGRELTFALVRYASPMAAVALPRWISTHTPLQGAAPAVEITRLLHMLGVGADVLRGYSALWFGVAALSLLLSVGQALRERQADLAMWRLLGMSAPRLGLQILLEAFLLGLLGAVLGLAIAHGLTELIGQALAAQRSFQVSGKFVLAQELLIVLGVIALSVLAAAVPLARALRQDVMQQLQSR